ncbi:hypothetical protein [Streptomyces cavernae]|uniref:hypothetical protein n=1 Tax=Streptomyces cavernae TaxID=2259034 RepID=UPI000FEBBF03|nr:hypothetical protein [Streptomyces cavernae]
MTSSHLAPSGPAAIGALRLDIASAEPGYREQLRNAFYGDVDLVVADAAIALLTPDVPDGGEVLLLRISPQHLKPDAY